ILRRSRLRPGIPSAAYSDPTFDKEQADAIKKDLGLDKPMSVQYVIYLKNLAGGNLGTSFFLKKPVFELLMDVFPNTLLLTMTAVVVADAFGVVAGAFLAGRRGAEVEAGGGGRGLGGRGGAGGFGGVVGGALFSVAPRGCFGLPGSASRG